jgi:small subunit ribosomal protein S16
LPLPQRIPPLFPASTKTEELNPEDVPVALTIRLMRVGSNKNPVFRLVAVDQKWGSKKGRVEVLGTVNPRAKELAVPNLKKERVLYWVSKGAIVSASAGKILKKLGVDSKAAQASSN